MSSFRALAAILPVQSVARAVDFYRTLGFTAQFYREADEYAFIAREDLELHLRRAPDLIAGHNPCGVYFHLQPGTPADLQHEFLTNNVPILSPLAVRPWNMNEFMISDLDGNLLRFGEPVTKSMEQGTLNS